MADCDPRQLLGYLLEALEDSERESLQEQLEFDAKLRQELAQLDHALLPLRADRNEIAPPPGLAVRTCRLIASYEESAGGVIAEVPCEPLCTVERQPKAMSAATDAAAAAGRFRWLDVGMAVAIFAAACLVIFPAIQRSRSGSLLRACQSNLRKIGASLDQYSQIHHGYFPYVPESGKLAAAGSYAVQLQSSGLLESPRWVLCPGAPPTHAADFQVPTIPQVVATPEGPELDQLQRSMGGDFGYSFGHTEHGRYQGTRNLHRPFFALVADAPSRRMSGYQSMNHGGHGQNVLFEDFHVKFLTAPEREKSAGNIYLNDAGIVGPGVHADDSVIGASGSTPFVFVGSRGR